MGQVTASNAPSLSPSQLEATNLQQLLGATLQIQEQLRVTQIAVEQSRQQASEAASRNAAALSDGLQAVREVFSAQQAQEFAAMQKSNRAMLVGAGTFAGVTVLVMLIMTYFQWRTSHSLAAISTALPTMRELLPASEVPALDSGDWPRAQSDVVEQSSSRLLGALKRLDTRIHDVKRAISSNGKDGFAAAPQSGPAAAGSDPSKADEHHRISALLDKAHAMMNLENPEAAVACFDEVLALDPCHTGALVKKGAALERLHKLNEAIECYDRAIALDDSMTTAYLHKGGLCNRLEQFKAALQCYEKALHTHEQRRS